MKEVNTRHPGFV